MTHFDSVTFLANDRKRSYARRQFIMSRMEYIVLTAIIGFYAVLFVTLVARAVNGLWRTQRNSVKAAIEKTSIYLVAGKMDARAWTRAICRGSNSDESHVSLPREELQIG